ncbi:MAG TPA: electron transport complex subunit RsxC [Clostridiales bacterium]|nr:electron transport complex subunit RsxC [Clostridiales bacterium]
MTNTFMAQAKKPVAKGHGGAHVKHHKDTASLAVERIPCPDSVTIPMAMSIGAPCTPTVKVGDEVKVGQVIGDSDKYVSAPIHASISGKVTAVKPVQVAGGGMVNAVTIQSDGEVALYEGLHVPSVETKADFLKAVRDCGLVGLGGAGFPVHVKLAFKEDAGVDTLIINAAECEPYITVDHREMLEHPEDILYGVAKVKAECGFQNTYIGIERNKPDAFETLAKTIAAHEEWKDIQLLCLKDTYPQGAEKVLIQSATGRLVPPGKLPSDVGCVVMNVQSVAILGRFLKTGMPLVDRALTVAGSAIAEPKNLRVPIGISLQTIVDYCGGFKETPYKILSGGPMMGMALTTLDIPLVKSNNALLAFAEGTLPIKPLRDCIRCGRCVDACPFSLVPTRLEKLAKLGNAEELEKAHVMACMECGTCAYACPSARPLVQYIRMGKAIVKEANAK